LSRCENYVFCTDDWDLLDGHTYKTEVQKREAASLLAQLDDDNDHPCKSLSKNWNRKQSWPRTHYVRKHRPSAECPSSPINVSNAELQLPGPAWELKLPCQAPFPIKVSPVVGPESFSLRFLLTGFAALRRTFEGICSFRSEVVPSAVRGCMFVLPLVLAGMPVSAVIVIDLACSSANWR
jgi:hypothetical protein